MRQHTRVVVAERPAALQFGIQNGARKGGRERRDAGVGEPDDPRSEEGGGAHVRQRIGQVAQERDGVLHLVSVEKAQALVHVRGHSSPLERFLVFTVAVTRPEQDRDVRRLDRTPQARRPIADNRALKQFRDLSRDPIGRGTDRLRHDQAER